MGQFSMLIDTPESIKSLPQDTGTGAVCDVYGQTGALYRRGGVLRLRLVVGTRVERVRS